MYAYILYVYLYVCICIYILYCFIATLTLQLNNIFLQRLTQGVCIGCNEDKQVRKVDMFECRIAHLFCEDCINATDLDHCPIHKLSARRPHPKTT